MTDQQGRFALRGAAVDLPDIDVVEAIGARAAAEPERPAVSDGEHRLSYRELWRRSGTVAGELDRVGVRAGSRVEVSVPRGVAYVVAAVGVLRSGAALMPADPTYPPARLGQMRGGGPAGGRHHGVDAGRLRSAGPRPERPRRARPQPGRRVLPVHLGLHRHAQGRGDAAPYAQQPHRLAAGRGCVARSSRAPLCSRRPRSTCPCRRS